MVKLLIDLGATITLAPGCTSLLLMSCLHGHADITTLLLEHWAKSGGFFPSQGGVWKRTRRCGSFAPSTDALRLTGRRHGSQVRCH